MRVFSRSPHAGIKTEEESKAAPGDAGPARQQHAPLSKYLVVSLVALDVNGKSLPGPPRSSSIKVSGTLQLVLLKEEIGRIGQSTTSKEICNPFTLITEITKTGEEAFHVKTNVSLTEIALDLPREMAQTTLAIIDHAFTALQGVSRVMVKFKSIVVDCCPSLAAHNEEEAEDDQGRPVDTLRRKKAESAADSKMALAVAVDIARMMTTNATTASNEVSWFRDAGDALLDVDWNNDQNVNAAAETASRREKEDEQVRARGVSHLFQEAAHHANQ